MQSDKSKALIDSITGSINTLAAMTDATAKSAMFKDWLRAVSRFHHYSFNNQLLVLLQRPQAQRVAGFHTWKSLGRNVKKGAKGIAILAPCVRKKTAEEAEPVFATVSCVAWLNGRGRRSALGRRSRSRRPLRRIGKHAIECPIGK